MSEIQRYEVFDVSGGGWCVCEDNDGQYVLHSDHASRVRELEEAVRVYRTALEEIRRGKTHADNVHPLGEYASQAIRYHNIARNAMEQASDAVKEAGR